MIARHDVCRESSGHTAECMEQQRPYRDDGADKAIGIEPMAHVIKLNCSHSPANSPRSSLRSIFLNGLVE